MMRDDAVFYQVCKKFVDAEHSVPADETTQNIMYYVQSIGHHVGTLDCLEERLRAPREVVASSLELLADESYTKSKLEALLRFMEIEIHYDHALAIASELKQVSALTRAMDDPSAIEQLTPDQHFLVDLHDVVLTVIQNHRAYLMVRCGL